MENGRTFLISERAAQAIGNYLSGRPYREVIPLMMEMAQLREYQPQPGPVPPARDLNEDRGSDA